MKALCEEASISLTTDDFVAGTMILEISLPVFANIVFDMHNVFKSGLRAYLVEIIGNILAYC